jgi:CTP:molybdopterin cytidylyltransferase MocA
MGKDKLRLPFGAGSTVLEQTALALSRAPVSQRILVVRDLSAPLFDAEALGFEVVEIGDEAALGMHRSLRRGLEQVDADAAMICLGDQPFVRTEDYASLLEAYRHSLAAGLDLLYPSASGRRGNPAVLHRRYFPEIFDEPDTDGGCRYLFERHPSRVRAWEPPTRSFFRDLDTLEEYRACLN